MSVNAHNQLLLAIGRYRSRYTLMMGGTIDQPPTEAELEHFGATWFHLKKEDWGTTLNELVANGTATEQDGRYELTERGQEELEALEVHHPLWIYEYENYYALAPQSTAHQKFCEQAYGMNLCQHGLVDAAQLKLLLQHIEFSPSSHAVDLGCGNGFITAWLARETQSSFIGIDLSQEGIAQAHNHAMQQDSRLKFVVGNMNALELPTGSFDVAIAIDTLYYLSNMADTLRQVHKLLKPGGKMALFFTQFVMDATEADRLPADGTDLARELQAQGLSYTTIDISEEGYAHWQKKLHTLEQMEAEFLAEGHEWLYQFRLREAQRYANWSREFANRYLYIVST